jgi:hypothetical protein
VKLFEKKRVASFSGCPLWTPFARLIGLAGSIDARRMRRIVNQYTLAFFEKHLNGGDPILLKGASPAFPEVDYIELKKR